MSTSAVPIAETIHHQIARALLALFRPRLDVYATRFDTHGQVARMNAWMTGKGYPQRFSIGDYKPAGASGNRKPLTLDAVVQHVAGKHTLGFYPLHPDGTANSVSIDFDDHRGKQSVVRDPREDLDACIAVCQQAGLRFIANHSRGGKGYWLHVLMPSGTQARVGRALLLAVVREAGLKHITEGGTFDALCPKQSDLKSASTSNPGNLFCVPLCGLWTRAETPGTHLINTLNADDLAAQYRALTEYG